MDMIEILEQVRELLQQKRRITYRLLKMQFQLDDEQLEVLKEELIDAEEVAADKDGKMLVWTGWQTSGETTAQTAGAPASEFLSSPLSVPSNQTAPVGERRQLTVMFCDMVGSTALSEQLDPEELQTVVRTYQEVSAQVIERYEGYIAQYLGDGLLVYFGYPAAHEDDAGRAIRAGLEIITALDQARGQFPQPVHIRIGIHTGPVVVGQVGGGSRHEQLALGETPNIAARMQGEAEPDSIVISAATRRLVTGLFEMEDQGRHALRGISTPQSLYRVVRESGAQSRFDVAVQTGLTPFVGREEELEQMLRRWERAQAGDGQAVLLSGEPGIGKSRLLQELKAHTDMDAPVTVACRCSPYLQNSALSPVIGYLQQRLGFTPTDSPETKLQKLEQTLERYDFAAADSVPLLASLLSLPLSDTYVPLSLSPQQQKEHLLNLLVSWVRQDAEQQPVRIEFEDLHWADPSTVEFLTILVEQVATMCALLVLTFRPEFTPPWPSRAYLLALYLDRLSQPQIVEMAERVAGKALPAEVVEQVVTKTDGVPLFVEELTKTVLESGQLQEIEGRYRLVRPLEQDTIPTTLQDSLRARLDRLNTAQEVAQIGATIGREFLYTVLQAVSGLEEPALQQGLRQLVEADLVYQRGRPPDAQYSFKHALVQDTAYQSLLKSKRQQLHHQIAHVLETCFAETTATQPELVAHHYTEAELLEQAIPYWQRAGERAVEQSANAEAVEHLSQGLNLLATLPDTPARAEQELVLQTAIGPALMALKGWGAVEVEQTYTRAQALCQQVGDAARLFPVLHGLWFFYYLRARYQTARELGEQLLGMAESSHDAALLLEAQHSLGPVLFHLGEVKQARTHLAQGIELYDPQQHHFQASLYVGHDPGVCCWNWQALSQWFLGYPDRAVQSSAAALALAEDLAHPLSLALALYFSAQLHQMRREAPVVQERADTMAPIAREQGFALTSAQAVIMRGWARAEQGAAEEGIAQIQQGLAASQSTGGGLVRPYSRALLAEAYGRAGQAEDGVTALNEALTVMGDSGERCYEAELYRLKGELLLQHSPENVGAGEATFLMALDTARQQDAKSWELRVATSLARLWQQQGKKAEARELLTPVYDWFTEGFDTADLKDAKHLLEELS